MSVSIIPCPSCSTMLLSDTAQCPTCSHVFDAARLREFSGAVASGSAKTSTHEDECPNCREMVRLGLVRCWNCGTFMRKDIADSYQKMRTVASPVIYSALPGGESDGDIPVDGFTGSGTAGISEDEDFELSPEIAQSRANDDDREFELKSAPQSAGDEPNVSQRTESPAPAGASSAEAGAQQEMNQAATATDSKSTDRPDAGNGTDRSESANTPIGPEEAHSVQTGGDVLLKGALQEEAETMKRRVTGTSRRSGSASSRLTTGILVFCPNGHRVEVQERHRGRTGRCPRCKSPFFVPAANWKDKSAATAAGGHDAADSITKEPGTVSAGRYVRWLTNVSLHPVNPLKLKLKPSSLAAAYQTVDLGFSGEELIVITLLKKSGKLTGRDEKKIEAGREEMLAHLTADKSVGQLSVVDKQVFDAEAVRGIRVAQPVPYEFESMFAGVPVFGEGRIAVRLPKTEGSSDLQFVSFDLSDFREFAGILRDLYSIENFGADCEIPITDSFLELKCHYTDQPLHVLEQVEFYQADQKIDLQLAGRRCAGCGLVVSEDGRKKENIGGKSGKGIAKAKCPKCKKKFGDISLFTIEKSATSEDDAGESPAAAEEPAAETADA